MLSRIEGEEAERPDPRSSHATQVARLHALMRCNGLTREVVRTALGWVQSKLSKWENWRAEKPYMTMASLIAADTEMQDVLSRHGDTNTENGAAGTTEGGGEEDNDEWSEVY